MAAGLCAKMFPGNHRQRTRLLSGLPADARALLRSQSGAYAGEWLRAIPADAGSTLAPPEMLIALRRRLRLPLPWQLFGVAAAASPTAAPTSMRSAMRKLSALKAAWCLSSGCCTPLAPARPPGVAKRCAAT